MKSLVFAVLALVASRYDEIMRSDGDPEGLSGITHAGGTRYYAVNDRNGELCAYDLCFSATNDAIRSFTCTRRIRLDGRRDLEGCAADVLRPGVVWVSDEADTSVRAFEVSTGREVGRVAIPDEVSRHVRANRSFEALAMAPNGLSLWVANEDTLTCDGEVAAKGCGGRVRLMEFVRTGASASWKLSRQLHYVTDPVAGDAPGRGLSAISGVAALAVDAQGDLFVLEREFSRKNPIFPTFRTRVYHVRVTRAANPVAKTRVFSENTFAANYEGMCIGPKLRNGRTSLVLVSDAGGNADAGVLVLAL